MKTNTFKLMILLLFVISFGYSQKVAVIGINHATPDGFSFLVTQDLNNGEVIYFTENEYNATTNAFDDQVEAIVAFTAGSVIVKGTVVFVNELTTADTFSVTCTGGGVCGTAVKVVGSGFFALASDGETLYAYSDTDNNPVNGVTTIHSVMFTGDTQPTIVNGGPIPANQDPTSDFPTAIVIDGFLPVQPNRVEFNPTALARTNITKAGLENASNYIHAQANATLSTIFFTNFNLGSSNPLLSVTAAPTSVTENSGTSIIYTFTLSSNATSNVTVNFNVSGSATFSSDYTQTGAASFNASTGTVTILNGTNSAIVTLTPIGDSTLEANENVILTLANGAGYDVGSPGAATTTILNDDTSNVEPLVALTGVSHSDPDGFSFVALSDIPASTVVYFTENSFNTSALTFGSGEAVLRWTAPASVTPKGNVIVITESAPDTFTVTCSSGGCGTIALLSGNFAIATTGETMYAYDDTDTNPSNGVTAVYSVLYTGTSTVSGGAIPTIEDPSTVYTNAIVVDGFPATAPARTEYNPTLRNIVVTEAVFENVSNWIHGQSPLALSTVPFTQLNVLCSNPPTPTFTQVAAICSGDLLSPLPTTSLNGITGTWSPALNNTTTTTYTFTPNAGQCGTTTTMTITVNPLITPTFTQVAAICSGDLLSPLPITSLNGITGTWSPALNNTTTTTYTFTPNAGQCSTTTTITITVNTTVINTTTITACDSYTWANTGITYTSSGTYTGSTTNCVTEELVLTINNSTSSTLTITACDSYTWAANNQTYTASGTYTNLTTNGAGCPDTATLVLTINTAAPVTINSSAGTTLDCNNLFTALGVNLNNTVWTQNGAFFGTANPIGVSNFTTGVVTYGVTGEDPVTGCTVTSNIVITMTAPTVNPASTITACDSYTWPVNGTVYTASGTFTNVVTNPVTGCTTTDTLNLTINNSTTTTTNVTQSTPYTWPVTGLTYSVSGTYTSVGINGAGCPDTQILNLVITIGPTTVINPTQCGSTLPTINTQIVASNVPGANRYRFEITDTQTNLIQVAEAQLRIFYLTNLPSYNFARTYSVRVAVRIGTVWQAFGPACNVTTPTPLTQIQSSQCNSILFTAGDIIFANNVPYARGYQFRIINNSTSVVTIVNRPLRDIRLTAIPGFTPVPGTTYTIEVAVRNQNGIYLQFGTPCNVTVPGGTRETVATKVEFQATAYPNPFSESFMIEVKTSSEESIAIRVYDMLGKLVEDRTVDVSSIAGLEIGARFPTGVYNVIVSQGDVVKTLRVAKR